MFQLGVSYENDPGAQKNLGLAGHFCRLATAQHHVASQYNLAVMMAIGKGVKRVLEKP